MALPNSIQDREHRKFKDTGDGVAVRVYDVGPGGGGSGSAGAATPTITNLSMVTNGTEYSHLLPTGTKKIMFKSRLGGVVNFGFATGLADYFYLPPGAIYSESDLETTAGLTLYATSTKDNDILEILTWT